MLVTTIALFAIFLLLYIAGRQDGRRAERRRRQLAAEGMVFRKRNPTTIRL
jgi:hypothetical protein